MEKENEKIEYRISMIMSVILIVFAGICDALSLIPLMGDIIAPIFWIIISAFLWIKGMGIVSGRKIAVTAISFITEMIPGIQELPMLIAGIIAMLIIIRIEDKTNASILKPITKGITPPRLKKNPVNSEEGIRQPKYSLEK